MRYKSTLNEVEREKPLFLGCLQTGAVLHTSTRHSLCAKTLAFEQGLSMKGEVHDRTSVSFRTHKGDRIAWRGGPYLDDAPGEGASRRTAPLIKVSGQSFLYTSRKTDGPARLGR